MPDIQQLDRDLQKHALILKYEEPLAPYSTMRVGGNARFFVLTSDSSQLKNAILVANEHRLPYLIVGKGSNIIFSDSGYDGLVLVNHSKTWRVLREVESGGTKKTTRPRFNSLDTDLKQDISNEQDDLSTGDVIIRVDSGVGINYLTQSLYKKGISGLEWFAGIPSTVGGAIYMNMHGGDYFFGDLVEQATILRGNATTSEPGEYFKFEYDWSILHQTAEIVLDADLRLKKGNVAGAKAIARKWAGYKSSQPRRTAGCIFRNLSSTEQQKLNLPTSSVGYLIDKVLNLKGKRIGDAMISNNHAAFIENLGNAKAKDVFDLMQLIKERAKSELGIDIIEEVNLIGRF